MMIVKSADAQHFYEDDEDPSEVFAVFDAGDKGITAPQHGLHAAQWVDRARHQVAVGLRRFANLIEPSHASR